MKVALWFSAGNEKWKDPYNPSLADFPTSPTYRTDRNKGPPPQKKKESFPCGSPTQKNRLPPFAAPNSEPGARSFPSKSAEPRASRSEALGPGEAEGGLRPRDGARGREPARALLQLLGCELCCVFLLFFSSSFSGGEPKQKPRNGWLARC